MNGNGLFKIFVTFGITLKNFLPRRQYKNMIVNIGFTGLVKMIGIIGLNVIQIRQNVR